MKRFLAVLAAALTLAALRPEPPVQAQAVVDISRFLPARPVAVALGSDDSDVALIVKYVGTSTSADIAVSAAGDLTFRDATVADATFECPVSGALGGVIDVSDAACNTLGEVVDIINASANWRAVILDGLRSDSSDDALVTIAATEATATTGLLLKRDTDVAFTSEIALVPAEYRRSIQPWLASRQQNAALFNPNPFVGSQTRLLIANATSTYGSGTSTWNAYTVHVNNATRGSEVVTQLYSTTAGATTVNKIFDFTNFGLLGDQGDKVVIRLVNSAAMASSVNYAYGSQFRY